MAAVSSPHTFTLTADTVATVTFTASYREVEVVSDGTAEISWTANGADPTEGGDGCQFLPAGSPNWASTQVYANGGAVVKLISSGTPKVSVRGVDAGSRGIGGGSSGGTSTVSGSVALNDGTTTSRKATVTAANAVKVDGSAVTQPVSAAALPLPSGAATAANQATSSTSLASIDTKTPALGQAAMAASQPVVVASDQSTLPVSAQAATRSAVTVLQNTAVATGNGTTMSVLGYAAAVVTISGISGDTITFEAQTEAAAAWDSIAAHQIGVNGSLAATATANGTYRLACAGYLNLRARVSTYSAGTITARGFVVATPSQPTAVALASGTNSVGQVTANAGTNLNTSALALDVTLTGGTQQAKVTDGTNVANVLKSDGTAAGQNSQFVAGTHLAVAFTTTTVQAVATTDCINYNWVSVHITSQGTSSVVTFQGSNDNTNWVSIQLAAASGGAGASATSASGLVMHGAVPTRYFRLNITAISAGTTAGAVEFFTLPKPTAYPVVQQGGTWTVQPGNTPNTTAWLVSQVAAVSGGYSFTNITANTAGTTVKSGAGTLREVIVNTAGASSNVLTLYDGTSTGGTKIGTYDTNSLRAIPFDLAFTTGLFAVLATGTAADLTILWK